MKYPVVIRAADWNDTDQQTNAAATATQAEPEGDSQSHFITHVSASYDDATVEGTLQLKYGSTVIMTWNFLGKFSHDFMHPIKLPAEQVANLVLSAGGASVVGDVNMAGYTN